MLSALSWLWQDDNFASVWVSDETIDMAKLNHYTVDKLWATHDKSQTFSAFNLVCIGTSSLLGKQVNFSRSWPTLDFPRRSPLPLFFFFFFFTSLSPSLPRHFPLSFPRTTRVTWVCHHFFFFYLPPGTYIEMAVFAQVEYTTKG